jgi:hypothetical protein
MRNQLRAGTVNAMTIGARAGGNMLAYSTVFSNSYAENRAQRHWSNHHACVHGTVKISVALQNQAATLPQFIETKPRVRIVGHMEVLP